MTRSLAVGVALVAAAIATVLGQEVQECAKGIHMIVARGSTEAPGLGKMGVVARNVSLLIPGSTISPVDYPATFDNYTGSVATGASTFGNLTAAYAARCPDTRVALLGYSQGGQALMDALCGNSQVGFSASPDLSASLVSSVIAAVTFGDPSHVAGASWNAGTSNNTGIFPRLDIASCEPYTGSIRGWCDTGDVYCDRGNNTKVHGSYFANYTLDAAEFIVERYNASLVKSTPDAPSTSTTPAPAATSSTVTNAGNPNLSPARSSIIVVVGILALSALSISSA